MKVLFKNEAAFTDFINEAKEDRNCDAVYADDIPLSYPCIVIYDIFHDYFGNRSWSIINIIYPTDFS